MNRIKFFMLLVWLISAITAQSEISQEDALLLKSRLYSASNIEQVAAEVVNSLKRNRNQPSIVSIGEATHGTEEIKCIQIECAKSIVSNLGFQSIAMSEYPFLDTYKILNFGLLEDSPFDSTVIRPNFDIKPLLLWLKEHNSSLSFDEKTWLIGADKNTSVDIIASLHSILNQNKFNAIFGLDEYKKLRVLAQNKYATCSIDTLRQVMVKIEETLNLHYSNLAMSTKDKVDLYFLRLAFRNLEFELKGKTKNDEEKYFSRDTTMFDNIQSIYEEKKQTVVIRGHNFHTNKITLHTKIFDTKSTLGQLLQSSFKEKYFSLATIIEKGAYYAGGETNTLEIKETTNKIGNIFGALTDSEFAVILYDSTIRETLNKYEFDATIGTAISGLIKVSEIGDAFDGLIFLKNSSPFMFYDNLDFYTLYLNLKDKEVLKIARKSEMEIAFRYKENSASIKSKICLNIFFNDSQKKILSKNYTCSTNSEDAIDKAFDIPSKTHFVSINLVGTNTNTVYFEDFLINGKKYNNFDLYDWNSKGYQLKKGSNSITVTK